LTQQSPKQQSYVVTNFNKDNIFKNSGWCEDKSDDDDNNSFGTPSSLTYNDIKIWTANNNKKKQTDGMSLIDLSNHLALNESLDLTNFRDHISNKQPGWVFAAAAQFMRTIRNKVDDENGLINAVAAAILLRPKDNDKPNLTYEERKKADKRYYNIHYKTGINLLFAMRAVYERSKIWPDIYFLSRLFHYHLLFNHYYYELLL
jgi:hypothetical protein